MKIAIKSILWYILKQEMKALTSKLFKIYMCKFFFHILGGKKRK